MRRLAMAFMAAMALGGAAHAEPVAIADLPFQIDAPADVTVELQRGPDFNVFYFNRDGRTLLGAYFGGYPDYKGKRSGTNVDQLTICQGGAVTGHEILLTLPAEYTTYVHAWTVRGDAARQAAAEAMLRSIRVKDRNPGIAGAAFPPCA